MNETFASANTDYTPPKPVVPEEGGGNPLASAIVSLVFFALIGFLAGGHSAVSMLLLISVLFIHESGHLAAMWLFGYQKLRMLFIPLAGAVAIGNKQDMSEKESAIILLAGPVPGMLIGYILLLGIGRPADGSEEILFTAARWFIYLNALNLLPFFPLDGGQLFRILFFRSGFIPYFIFAIISMLMLVLLFWHSYIILIYVVFFFGRPLIHQFKAQRFYKALKAKNVDHRKTYDELSDHDFWMMHETLPYYSGSFRPAPAHLRSPLTVSAEELRAIRSLLERRIHDDLGFTGRFFFASLWTISVASVFVVDYFHGGIGVLQRLGF